MTDPESALLFIDRDMEGVQMVDFAGGQVACYTRRCPTRESGNEDAFALIPMGTGGVLVLADGAGGTRGGAQASATLVYEMVANLEAAAREGSSLREAILNGLECANREINALGIGAATTAVVAEIQGSNVRPYHVGDSGILLAGQKGKLKLQSIAHSPVGYAVESGYLHADEALHHEDRHLVSNMIGVPDMRIELGSAVELAARDTLLLASDGLFDNLTLGEVVEILRKGTLAEAAEALRTLSAERMQGGQGKLPSKPDDFTIVLFRREG